MRDLFFTAFRPTPTQSAILRRKLQLRHQEAGNGSARELCPSCSRDDIETQQIAASAAHAYDDLINQPASHRVARRRRPPHLPRMVRASALSLAMSLRLVEDRVPERMAQDTNCRANVFPKSGDRSEVRRHSDEPGHQPKVHPWWAHLNGACATQSKDVKSDRLVQIGDVLDQFDWCRHPWTCRSSAHTPSKIALWDTHVTIVRPIHADSSSYFGQALSNLEPVFSEMGKGATNHWN